MNVAKTIVAGERLELHPHRGIWWSKERTLFLADLHIGKAAHFRSEGIQMPAAVILQNLYRFSALLEYYDPKRVLILGDLFHSDINNEWQLFTEILADHSNIEFHLVVGNHDNLTHLSGHNHPMIIHERDVCLGPFCLSHHPKESIEDDKYHLCGHLHPGIRLRGRGRQSLRLACFYFGKQQGILPAFGELTGKFLIDCKNEDQVFVVTEDSVIEV